MRLRLGMRVIDNRTWRSWQVVDFDNVAVRLRPLVYRATMDGRGPMEWAVPLDKIDDAPVGWLRENFDVCFTEAGA